MPADTVQLAAQPNSLVIPAQAGIHERILLQKRCLDSRLRGNDEIVWLRT